MNVLALLALLVTLGGWVLTALTGMNLLSGHFDDRTCQTDCVQGLFFSAVAAGLGGLLLAAISFRRPQGRLLSILALLVALGLWALFGTLFIAGNFV
jgi:hypothetical protein